LKYGTGAYASFSFQITVLLNVLHRSSDNWVASLQSIHSNFNHFQVSLWALPAQFAGLWIRI
jgi:hypothetical protein